MQSGRQTVRQLIIFRRTCTPANLFWVYSYTPGYLILGVLAKFSGVYYPCTPVNGSLGSKRLGHYQYQSPFHQ